VHHLVGVAVTPVVCFIGEVGMSQLNPNPSEVSECFTVPLELFIDNDRYALVLHLGAAAFRSLTVSLSFRWVHKKHYAPFFTGAPHIIWGLTGYVVNRFVMDVISRYTVVFDDNQ
jgi:hypothetical protein